MVQIKNIMENRRPSIAPWNLALDALDYHKNTFRYFALQNPPDKEPSNETQPKNHMHGSTITNKTYFEVQNLIKEQITYLSDKYGMEGRELNDIYDFVLDKMKKLYKEAYKQEQNLYSMLLPEIQEETGLPYSAFVKNTLINGQSMATEIQDIAWRGTDQTNKAIYYKDMSTIELWTRAANNALQRNNLNPNGFIFYFENDRDADLYAFTRILSSREFYNALQGPLETQIFSRTGALKKKKSSGKTVSTLELTDKISYEAIEQLVEDIQIGLGETIYDDGNSIFNLGSMKLNVRSRFGFDNLRTNIAKGLATVLKNYYGNEIEVTNTGKWTKIDMSKATRKNKSTSAVQVSKMIREKLSEIIDNAIDGAFGKDEKAKQEFGRNFSITISDGNGGAYFVVTSNKYSQKSILYQATKEKFEELKEKAIEQGISEKEFSDYLSENFDVSKLLIETVFNIFEQTIKNMDYPELNMLSLGTLNIKNFISKCYIKNATTPYFVSQKDFYNKAAYYAGLAKMALEIFFGKGHGISYLWKSFKIANSNAFLSGLFGEIAALSDINTIFKKYGFMTGSYSSMLGYGDTAHMAGQSVNDIRNSFKTGQVDTKGRQIGKSVGTNIKHYVMHEGNTLTLYSSKNNDGLSVYSPEMDKYLSKEDSNILRFITSNSGYFNSEEIIKRIGITIANLHLAQFYRAVDFTRGSALNIFYELNNVIYPLTYIYQSIINELEMSKKDISRMLLDVKLSGAKEGKPPMYKDVDEAGKKWKDSDWKISERGKKELDMKIKTKGLKVNLVSLNLFQ